MPSVFFLESSRSTESLQSQSTSSSSQPLLCIPSSLHVEHLSPQQHHCSSDYSIDLLTQILQSSVSLSFHPNHHCFINIQKTSSQSKLSGNAFHCLPHTSLTEQTLPFNPGFIGLCRLTCTSVKAPFIQCELHFNSTMLRFCVRKYLFLTAHF